MERWKCKSCGWCDEHIEFYACTVGLRLVRNDVNEPEMLENIESFKTHLDRPRCSRCGKDGWDEFEVVEVDE